MSNSTSAQLLLRLGLAFTLIYAGVAAQLNPDAWIGFFPTWLKDLIPGELLLKLHSTGDILLGLWLIAGYKVFYPAVLTALFMGSIVVFNFGALDIAFRDVGLFFMALALAALTKPETQKTE